jgi:MFS family permease
MPESKPSQASTGTTPTTTANQFSLIAGLVLAVSIHAYDELVLAISMPVISQDLNGFEWYGLSFASYLLASLVGIVWAGSETDKRGPLRIFMLGSASFLLGLILASAAQNMETLLLGRALQGLGGGISWTVAFAVINIAFEPLQRPKMIAILDTAWIVPSLIAPLIGGYIVDYLNWRWIFIGQIPILCITTYLLYPKFKNIQPKHHRGTSNAIATAVKLALYGALLLYAFNQEFSLVWLITPFVLMLAWRPFSMLMPKGFYKQRDALSMLIMLQGLVFFAFYGIEIFLPILSTDILGFSNTKTGIIISIGACSWCVASFLQAWLSQRLASWQSLFLGFLIALPGVIALLFVSTSIEQSSLSIQSMEFLLYTTFALIGFGMGIGFNSCVSDAMHATEPGREGATSTSLGIMSSLAIGLISGLGGAILNLGDRMQWPVSDSLSLIWFAGMVAIILSLFYVGGRYRHQNLQALPTSGKSSDES